MLMSCDICGQRAQLTLLSSGCAPVTYAACQMCRAKRAENIDVAITWYHLEGGTDASNAYLSRLVTWNHGEYIGEEGILCYYAKHRDELIAEMAEEVELVDDTMETDKIDHLPSDKGGHEHNGAG